jgi:PAS domain-containing protein
MWESLALAAGLGVTAIASTLGGLVVLTILRLRFAPETRGNIFREGQDATVLLFDGEDLVDATPSAHRLIAESGFADRPWFALMERLAPRFDELPEQLSHLAVKGSIALQANTRAKQPLALRAEMRGGLTKIVLLDPTQERTTAGGDFFTVHALDGELQDLRDASNAAPFPIWRIAADGDIIWANTAYMTLLLRVPRAENEPEWPLRRLFDVKLPGAAAKARPKRLAGPADSGWFDILVRDVSDGKMFYALPANDAAAAGGTLTDFKQTLTNTFAELSTGLAVFDKRRNLQLFNPSLAQLIQIPVEMLLKRPALFALLDAMRDNNMLPEPKDYRSWRHQMVDLEAAALRGDYKEIWHLPNGKAFQVVGRPYPNGALALMIDDITDEITRDRLFRGELDMALAVIGHMEDGVVAFSQGGLPILVNAAYRRLWGHDPEVLTKAGGIGAVFDAWRVATAPSLFWAEAEAAVAGGIAALQDVRLIDGRLVSCRTLPLPGGATAITFRLIAEKSEMVEQAPLVDLAMTA